MRIRVPELLKERGWTAYELSRQSGGKISMTMAYRLERERGRLRTFNADLLEELVAAFGVSVGDLLEPEPRRKRASATPRTT